MTYTKYVVARKAGTCAADFAHDRAIRPGDRIMISTAYPGDDFVETKVPIRMRLCSFCRAQFEEYEARVAAAGRRSARA